MAPTTKVVDAPDLRGHVVASKEGISQKKEQHDDGLLFQCSLAGSNRSNS